MIIVFILFFCVYTVFPQVSVDYIELFIVAEQEETLHVQTMNAHLHVQAVCPPSRSNHNSQETKPQQVSV